MIMRKALYLTIFSILFVIQNLYPQYSEIKFERFTTNDGLSNNTVSEIYNDKQNYLWLVTRKGLSRFDGSHFKNYRNEPDFIGHEIYNVSTFLEDSYGNFWMGGTATGLIKYDYSEINLKTFSKASNAEFESDNINTLFEDANKTVWIGTDDGLIKFDVNKQNFTIIPKPANQNPFRVTKIFEDKRHRVWVMANNRLYLLNTQNRQLSFETDIHFPPVKAIEIADNKFWIAGEGAIVYDIEKHARDLASEEKLKALSQGGNILDIEQLSTGEIWVGTDGGGLRIYNPATNKISIINNDESDNFSLSRNAVYSITEDRQKNIWVGTVRGGLNKWSPKKWKFAHYYHKVNDKNSLALNDVISFIEDKEGFVWIGTDGGGLDRFDPVTNSFKHFQYNKSDANSLSDNVVTSVMEDSNGNIWTTTYNNGVNLFDKKQNKFFRFTTNGQGKFKFPGNSFISLYEYDGFIWIGSHGLGILKLNPKTFEYTIISNNPNDSTSLSANAIQLFYADSKNNLWIGTVAGLDCLNPDKIGFIHFRNESKNPASISNNGILKILEDHQNNLWVGTANGLNKFDQKTKTFHRFTIAEGLPDNSIMGIQEDAKGNLWLSTNNGICSFDVNTNKIKIYDKNDGVQDNQFLLGSLKTRNGEIYFGGVNGFNRFNPAKIIESKESAPLVISDFRLFGKSVQTGVNYSGRILLNKDISQTSVIELNYEDWLFSVEFNSIDYVSPSKIKYTYFLENLDEQWNFTVASQNYATYTKLAPGKYTFRVKATNSDGVWNKNEAVLHITINPPFWMTWWFRILSVLVIAVSVIGFFLYRINSINKQKKILEIKVEERTIELKEVNADLLEQKEELKQQAEELRAINEDLEHSKERVEKSYRAARLVSEFGEKITSTFNIDNINKLAYDFVQKDMDVYGFGIGIYNQKNDEIFYKEYLQKDKPSISLTRSVKNNNNITAWVIENRKPLYVKEMQKEFNNYSDSMADVYEGSIPNSEILIPLIVDDRIVGIFAIASLNKAAYSDQDYNFLLSLASYIAIALDNSSAYQAVQLLNATKDKFFSIIAHDLKNPIASISELSKLFHDFFETLAKDEMFKFVSMIRDGAVHSYELLINLLDWARSQRGTIEFEPVKLNIEQIIDKNIELQTATAFKKHINLRKDIKANTIAFADENMTTTVLRNLLSNALKFTPENGEITLGACYFTPDGFQKKQQVKVWIKDTGIGLRPEDLGKLFRIDVRNTDIGTTSEGKGTGLGLIMCKEFIDKNNGQIWAESELNVGTTFYFTLPCNENH